MATKYGKAASKSVKSALSRRKKSGAAVKSRKQSIAKVPTVRRKISAVRRRKAA